MDRDSSQLSLRPDGDVFGRASPRLFNGDYDGSAVNVLTGGALRRTR